MQKTNNKLVWFMPFGLLVLLIWGGVNPRIIYAGLNILYTQDYVRYDGKGLDSFKVVEDAGISLAGAGNETLSFQIVLESQERLRGAYFKIDDLIGPQEISSACFDPFLVGNCQGKYSADCLIPLDGNAIPRHRLNDHINRINVWIDLRIPFAQRSGDYHGRIQVIKGNTCLDEFKINLNVYPFSLPVKPSLKADLNNYGVGFVKEWGMAPGSTAWYGIERSFYVMANTHRMTFNPLPYKSQRGTPHPFMAPDLEGQGAHIKVKSWDKYDERYAPLFDGRLFKGGVPIDHQYLPFNPQWPSAFVNYSHDREMYEKEWGQIAAAFVDHFEEKGWSNTIFQIYLNQKPASNNTIPWHLDEPKGTDDYHALRYFADLSHRVFKNRERFKFRIDISHFYCDKHKDNPQKDFRVNGGESILKPMDIWVISKHSLDCKTAQDKALKLTQNQKTVYEYFAGNRMPLITDSIGKGIEYGWKAWIRHEDGILFWNTVKRGDKDSNGEDFLIYTGEKYGIRGPIASIRLKAIRRGIQDYEYIKIISKHDNNKVKRFIAEYITKLDPEYNKCRKEMAAFIISEDEK